MTTTLDVCRCISHNGADNSEVPNLTPRPSRVWHPWSADHPVDAETHLPPGFGMEHSMSPRTAARDHGLSPHPIILTLGPAEQELAA